MPTVVPHSAALQWHQYSRRYTERIDLPSYAATLDGIDFMKRSSLRIGVCSSIPSALLALLLTSSQGWSQTNDVLNGRSQFYRQATLEVPEPTSMAELSEGIAWLEDEISGSGEEDVYYDGVHYDGVHVIQSRRPFTARVGPVFVKRGRMDDVAILIDNNGAGPTVLNASDFAFDYETGIDASVIYDRCDWPVSLESRYLWINDWTSARSGVD
jgi:hypothetical protein